MIARASLPEDGVSLSARAVLRRMAGTGSGTLISFALTVFVPFIAGAALPTEQFAMWALLNTAASLSLTLDFGATTMLPALLARHPPSHRSIIRAAVGLTAAGSLLVGAISMAGWWAMHGRLSLQSWTLVAGEIGLLGTMVGSVLRSFAQVVAGVALVCRNDFLRNALIVFQASCQALLTCVLLFFTRSAWSLPIGLCVSGFAATMLALVYLRRLTRTLEASDFDEIGSQEPLVLRRELRRYAASRTATVSLSGILTQADRWIVGAVGGPSQLVAYELAWRYAVVPKFAVLAGTQYLVPDIARLRSNPGTIKRIVSRSTLVAMTIVASAIPVILVAALITFPLLHQGHLRTFVPFLVLLLIGHCAHALTAPGTMAINGIGEPQREIPYLVVAVVIALAGWSVSWYIHSALMVAVAVSAAFVVGTAYFWVSRPWQRRRTAR